MQNHLELLNINPANCEANLVFEEKEKTYIDIHNNLTFYDDDSFFLWTSEKDGFNHVYKYSYNSKKMIHITKGQFEVTSFYGYDKKKKLIHLICRIKGEKVYDDYTEVKNVEVDVDDVELVVESIIKKVKLEIK